METLVKSCPLCGHATHGVATHERMITLDCQSCGGIVHIAFDPPDAPSLRGRITVIRSPRHRREIVLVDDNYGFLTTLGAFLRREGYAVVAEDTWFSAVHYLRHHMPNILITDVRIGNANGWELAAYAKRRHPQMPVVMVTGFEGEQDHAANPWGLPVFLKPFDADDLLGHVRAAVAEQ
jgi:CheY-like chemotaxis protein